MSATHEMRFTGPGSRSVRAKIRAAAKAAWLDGAEAVERAILGLGGTVVTSASDLATLRLVALDFVEDHVRWTRARKP